MFLSTIIATIDRPTLARAVQSGFRQEFDADDFELIVVNNLGSPLPFADWHTSPRVTNVVTNRREGAAACNTGAAIARGRYMYFMDDDNWLLPDALRNVWDAAQIPGDAVVLAGGMRVIDGTGKVRDEVNFRPSRNSSARVLGGAYPLLGSYWVRNDAFFASGGFDRRFGGADDAHLPIRLALPGDFAHIPVPVAHLLRGATWTISGDHGRAVEENRLIRDAALDEPNAYGRLRAAAGTAYWKGRLAHVYASSCVLKLRSRRPSKFLSRGLHMASALASSGTALVGREHWRGFKDDQIPGSLSQVMQRIEQAGSEPGLTSGKGERWTVSDCLPPDRERLNMPMVIVVGPEDKIRVQEAKQGLAPRVDYRLIAEGFPGTTVEEWYPSPAFLHGTKPSRVARSLSANFSQAMASIKQLPPDSVIYSTGETWGIPMALALTLSGASHRHVVYVHRVFTAHWLALLRTLRPVMRVHGWICVTEHQRKLLARALGSRAAPVTAISQGVDTAFYNSASPVPTVASSYILAVGAEMRNYQLLFDAVRSLDVSVVVRPSSPWLQRPRSGFRRVPSNVSVVTQPLSYGDLRDLYANALLVAVPLRPTLQAAGITTILEAMAMGKCVVATKSQGLPDILCDGMTGAVVEQRVAVLRATLARCVADAAWRESLGDAGRRMVRDQASLEYHASQVTAFIHQAAGA